MSGNHTPTPWRVDGYHSVIGPDGKEIHANGFSSIMSYGPAMLDARANAELIVTAVNSYASSQAEIERLAKALRNIAEGNLGDDPWQANYDKIRTVAVEALSGTPQTASEAFADWLNKGPKLALAAGCHVGIKVTEAKAALSGSKK